MDGHPLPPSDDPKEMVDHGHSHIKDRSEAKHSDPEGDNVETLDCIDPTQILAQVLEECEHGEHMDYGECFRF